MAFEDIIKLAEAGDIDAMVLAVQEFVWNEHEFFDMTDLENQIVKEKIVQYLNTAILSGNVTAMNQLGAMYAEGRLVERSPEQAFLFYKMATDHGDVIATSNLGFCYLYGTGTEKNPEEAYKAFSKVALMGVDEALVRLGDMFRNGMYVTKDLKMAYDLYYKACKASRRNLDDWNMQQVYSDSCARIGDFYLLGEVVEKDVAEAVKWYATALKYYEKREKHGDFYCKHGLQRTKEKLIEAVGMLD